MKIVNVAVAGTKAEANKKRKEWTGKYAKVTIRKEETKPSAKKSSAYQAFGKYYYVITAWG